MKGGDSDLCKKSFGKNNLPNSIKSLDALCNISSFSDTVIMPLRGL